MTKPEPLDPELQARLQRRVCFVVDNPTKARVVLGAGKGEPR